MQYAKFLIAVMFLSSSLGMSQDSTETKEVNKKVEEVNKDMEQVVVVGTRTSPRSVTDSTVPVGVIFSDELQAQGATDMLSMIKAIEPSFNVNDHPISDAATMVRPANLRGLSPDHTLILVNGKRRHRASVITFNGGALSNGAQGPDISVIPAIALQQVGILKDGAAAQYGADAIAGVINFVLKDARHGGSAEVKVGSYYEGDGGTVQYAGNIGMPLTEKGFVNLSFEHRVADSTSRSVQRTGAAELIQNGNTNIKDPAQIWGAPQIDGDLKLFVNSGLDLSSQMKAYVFGNYAQRSVEGGFYFRNPHTRQGVYKGENGNLLVGDKDGVGNGEACPAVPVGSNVLTSPEYASIANDETAVGQNCWAFNERYPGGFTPQFGGTVKDSSVVTGLRGETDQELRYDLSFSWGNNSVDHTIRNTVNASLGEDSPSSFKPSSYIQNEKSVNLDLVKTFDDLGWLGTFSLAGGLEYRQESFDAIAGDEASYKVGPLASQGFSIGSNGFSGLSEKYAGKNDRSSQAIYLDSEIHPLNDLLLTMALRHEKFSDFGDVTIGKVSTRYSLSDNWALRGALSTGFKAPTVGQSNVRNVTTTFEEGGLVDRVVLPPADLAGIIKGASALKPEESNNFSVGFVGEWGQDFFVTVDYFRIDVKDRISITSDIELTDKNKEDLETARVVESAQSLNRIGFFTNDFSTKTHGIDVVTSYDTDLFYGKTRFIFALNWTETSVDKVKTFDVEGGSRKNISDTDIKTIERNLPRTRFNLAVDYKRGSWRLLNRLNYFSSTFENHSGGLFLDMGSEYTMDLELSYKFKRGITFIFGVQNIFNEKPDVNIHRGVTGSLYPETSPIGTGGGFYYTRIAYTF